MERTDDRDCFPDHVRDRCASRNDSAHVYDKGSGMTWSIVTHDPATGAFAVAVATKAFAVGASCPFVRSGVGAVSTQSFTNRYLGPRHPGRDGAWAAAGC